MTYERGQRVVPGAVIPPPATKRPKPPPPPAGWPNDRTSTTDDLAQRVIDAHTATYHLGQPCQENRDGACADRFGEAPTGESA